MACWTGRGEGPPCTEAPCRPGPAVLAALIFVGCATSTRGVQRRSDEHIENRSAVIESDGVSIEKMDGKHVSQPSPWLVAPGRHALVVSLDDRHPAAARSKERRLSSRPLAICFQVSAGHRYLVRPTYHGWQWQADLFEGPRGEPVPVQAGDAATSDCASLTVELSARSTGATPRPRSCLRNHASVSTTSKPILATWIRVSLEPA